ncbi:MAG: alpha/beta hydrolase [Lentisphaeria bacterium]|nr:alpha/beta hydrolase [Lentisphaeria bacterium]
MLQDYLSRGDNSRYLRETEPELLRAGLRGRSFRLWKQEAPFTDAGKAAQEEFFDNSRHDGCLRLHNVSVPEVTFLPVESPGPAPAVIVCPGGGYAYLSYEREGFAICDFLKSIGFTAFLLKYRCPDQRRAARADAARAVRFCRYHAGEFNIDPGKLGIIGFSAGAHLAAAVSAAKDAPSPEADEMDKISFVPDYTALIYPAYLATEDMKTAPQFAVTGKTPPTFIVQTEDDGIRVENALVWYKALRDAGVKAEMHLYECGGHGYSTVCRPGIPVTGWQHLAEKWFRLRLADGSTPAFSKEVVS